MPKMFDDISELAADPGKWGVPTFDEVTRKHYSKRDQMFGRDDEMLEAIDRGDPMLGCRQKYYINHFGVYRCESIEQAERIARDMGLDLKHDFIEKPQLRQDPSERLGYYNEVTFLSKESIAKRERWG